MKTNSLRIVVPRYGPGIVGGSEMLAQRLAIALTERRWDIHVWSSGAEDDATWSGRARDIDTGCIVRRFAVAARRRPRLFHQASRALFRMPELVRPEALWFRLQGPYTPELVSALSNATGPTLFTPYLYYPTVYGLPAAPHPRVLIPAAHDERPFRLAAVRRALLAADALWYGTPEERALVESVHPESGSVPHEIGTVGVDVTDGVPQRFRARLGFDDPFLLYGGRTATGKGIETLLEAYRLLVARGRAVRLVLAGGAQAGAGATIVGRLDEQSWRDARSAALAMVIPSAMESLSLLALDTWAAGRPCLVSASSAVLRGQVERSGGGLAFSGAEELAAHVDRFLDEPEYADRMGAAGRQYVRHHYQWDDVVQRLRRLLGDAR